MPPDENTPAVESSPAAPAATAVEIPTNREQYNEWRKTGKVAPPADKTTDKAADEEKSATSKENSENTAPVSETGKQQERKPGKAEARLNELLADIKAAGYTPAELKTLRREAQQQQAKTEPVVEQPKTTPEKTDKPAVTDEAPKPPKLSEWQGTYEEYEAAKDKYHEDLADYKARKAIEEYQRKQSVEAATRTMNEKLAEAQKRYGDESKSVIAATAKSVMTDPKIPQTVKDIFEHSPVVVDLLYAMGSQSDHFAQFVDLARTNPAHAIRAAVLTERLVIEELQKGAKASSSESGAARARDDSGKFTAPEPKKTSAPPPPTEVSGHGTAPPDEVESAATAGDFTRYRREANARDLRQRTGR